MTFTTPGCPYGPALIDQIKSKINDLKDVKETNIEVVYDPPWEPNEELRAVLGL